MRTPLNPDRVVAAAAAVADAGGLGAVSMRNVARELGVEAMSLYHHVAGKEALLDGLADWAFTQIHTPGPAAPWRAAMTERAHSARSVLAAHPWALGLLESRSDPGEAILRHHEAVLGNLRGNGFSVPLAAHAFSVLDAYVFGFVLTEVNLPFAPAEGADAFIEGLGPPLERYPHLAEMANELVLGRDYAYGSEFGYGLELILDQLQARLDAS